MDAIPHGRYLTGSAMIASSIAKALGWRKAGASWMDRCPAHDDHRPSLSIIRTLIEHGLEASGVSNA